MRSATWTALAVALAAMLAALGAAGVRTTAVSAEAQDSDGLARLVFSSQGRITTVAADGSGPVRLTAGVDRGAGIRADTQPAPSPHGATIAFTRELADDRFESHSTLYTMNADGSEQRPLLAGGEAERHSPAFSPDGSRLAFAALRDSGGFGTSTISIVSADGSGERAVVKERLTERRVAFVGDPVWSPDGSQILYTRYRYSDDGEIVPSIHVVDLASGASALLRRRAADPAYSPDGSLIAFASTRDENGERCGSDECYYAPELYVMRGDGGGLMRLTHNKGAEASPAWSPDGERIVFSSDRNWPSSQRPELYSIAPDGSCLTWLTNGTATSTGPAWLAGTGSSAPGVCGDAERPALREVGIRGVAKGRDYEPLWLGETVQRSMLSDVNRGRAELIFDYQDCSAFEPRDCGPSAYVVNTAICSRATYLALGAIPVRFGTRRGVLTASFEGGGGLHAYSGGAEIFLAVAGRWGEREGLGKERALIDRLRPLAGRDARRLPPTVLQRGLVRRARRIAAAASSSATYRDVAERFDVNLVAVTNSVRLVRALPARGRLRTRAC